LCNFVLFIVESLYYAHEPNLAGQKEKLTFTASKLIRESTAKVAPLLSAAFASLRNFVLKHQLNSEPRSRMAYLHAVVVTVNQE
jgi:hypothetical protein